MTDLTPIDPAAAVKLYLKDREAELASATLRSHRSRLQWFVQWYDDEGIGSMHDLDAATLRGYQHWRREHGDDPNAVTVKSQIDTVRQLFKWSTACSIS